MSTTVDQRVVEMRFDNRHFESNVQTSMSTIDKLKQKLDFKGAEKGFDNISAAAKKVDMDTLGKSVETVRAKFSALEVVGVTALANITNSAVNAGKRLAKSLSIDQVTAGWNKYEQKTASVQTIMNATGKSIDEVNGYLQKLMWFSDETSYGFTDMTAALGQMTSSGGKIENLIPLITGVANATAYAGKGASEFSRVMYNLNQSYGAGYLQLMDWKSVELAGVGSKQLKQVFIDTAEQMGKIKKGQVTIANFSQTLKDKWADTEVMEAAFGRFGEFSDAVYKLSEDIDSGNLSAYPEDIQKLAEDGKLQTTSEMIEALSKHYDELGTQAFRSAQEAKTFTEAIDATKDAVSSGWMKTFEIIFGNYVQQKELWTDLANWLWDVFASGGESRNAWLEKVLSYNPLEEFAKKLDKVSKAIEAPVKKLEEYNEIVNRIIRGDFGNGQSRWDKLAEAGYDWAHAQNLVNEKLGSSVRHATDYNEAQKGLLDATLELTDAQLEEAGLTKEEIELYRELEAQSKKTGKSIGELVEEMKGADTRTLLFGSFRNIGNGILGLIRSIKEAFSEIFPPASALQIYNLINGFNKLTEKLRLINDEEDDLNETGQKLKRTFKGIFAAIDIILTVVSGPFKIAFKILGKILEAFNLPILDVTAGIGDAIVAFRDWIDEILDFNKIFEFMCGLFGPMVEGVKSWIQSFKDLPFIQQTITKLQDVFSKGFSTNPIVSAFKFMWSIIEKVAKGLKKCFDAFMSLPAVQRVVSKLSDVFGTLGKNIMNGLGSINLDSILEGITGFFDSISKWFSSFGDQDQNGFNLMAGLGKGIGDGIGAIINAIIEICKAIYNTFTSFFGIHSPSKVFFTLGKFCIAGLVAGLLFAKNDTTAAMGEIGTSLLEGLKSAIDLIVGELQRIDLRTVFAVVGAVGMYKTVDNLLNVINKFGDGVKGFGSMCSAAGGLITDFRNKVFPKETKMEKTSNMVLKMAAAIGILAASIYVLAQLDAGQLWGAVGAIAVLSLILVGLTLAASKLKVSGGDFGKLSKLLLGLAAVMYIMATAIKKLEFLNWENLLPVIIGFGALVGGLYVLLLAFGKLTKGTMAKNIDKAAIVITKIALTLLLLTFTLKRMSKLDGAAVLNAIGVLTIFGAFIGGLIWVTKFGGKSIDGLGATILKLSVAIILLVWVIKRISKLDGSALSKGITCIAMLGGVITGLIAATRLAGGNKLDGVGKTIIGLSAGIILLTLAVKMLSGMDVRDFAKGIICVTLLGGVITGLIAATRLAGDKGMKGVPATLLAASLSMALLAGIAILLSLISVEGLVKGITAVTILGSIMALMIWATRGANECQKSIIAMTTAIGIMAASIFVLSLLDPTKLATATLALSSVMGMFALLIKMAGTLNTQGKGFGRMITVLVVLTAIVAVISGLLVMLASVPNPDAVLPAAVGIGVVLSAMALSLSIINNSKTMSKEKLTRAGIMLGVLAGVVAAIAVVLGLLASLTTNPDALVPSAIALGTIISVMAGVLATLSAVKVDTKSAMTGIIALTAMVIPLIAFAGALWLVSDWIKGLSDMTGDFILLTAIVTIMSGLAIALSTVGIIVSASLGTAMIGLVALVAMAGELVVFAAALWACQHMIKGLSDMSGDFKLLTEIMVAMTALLVVLTVIGPIAWVGLIGMASLIDMVPMICEFAEKLKEVPDIRAHEDKIHAIVRVLDPIVQLAKEVAVINLLNFGGDGLKGFAEQIVHFAAGIVTFNKKLNTTEFDEGKIKAAARAGKALADTARSIPFDWGNDNLKNFAAQIPIFGAGLKLFNDYISKEDFNPDAIKAAAKAGKELALAAKEVPGILGNVSFGMFSNQLDEFGTGLKNFSNNLGTGEGSFDADKAKAAAKSAKELALAAKEVPGVLGNVSFALFNTQLDELGSGLGGFSGNLGTFQSDKAIAAAKAAKDIAEAVKGINGFDPFAIKDFARQLGGEEGTNLGNALRDFNNNVSGIGDFDNLGKASDALSKLATFANELPTTWGSNTRITEFANQLGGSDGTGEDFINLGQAIKNFDSQVKSISVEQLTSAVNAAKTLAEAAATIPEALYEMNVQTTASGHGAKITTSTANVFSAIGNNLGDLGSNIKSFADNTEGVDPAKLTAAATAVKDILPALSTICETLKGDDANKIDTEKINAVSGALGPLGTAISEFNTNLGKNTDYSNVKTACSAATEAVTLIGKLVTELNKTTSEDGEELELKFTDKIDFGSFKENMTNLGDGISGLASKLEGIDGQKIVDSANAAKTATEALKNLFSKDGDAWDFSMLTSGTGTEDGANAVAPLVNYLTVLGEGINAFYVKVKGVKVDQIETVATKMKDNIIPAVNQITDTFGLALSATDRNNDSAFVVRMQNLGTGIQELSKVFNSNGVSVDKIQKASDCVTAISGIKVPAATDIDAANSSLTELVETIKTLGGLDQTSIDNFNTNMGKIGTDGIKKFVESFAVPNTSVNDAINAFISSAATTIAGYASTESVIYTGFYNVGVYAVDGFVQGISDNIAKVAAAGTAIGEYAMTAAKKKIDSNSPSREFMTIGGYVVSGFAKGITDNLGDVKDSAFGLGDTMLEATQKRLKIHSPSLVFKEEVGRWIVKGIAEGITKDMSAEEAMEKKAQNIVDAFSKKLDSIDLSSEITNKEFKLWELQNGDKATQAEKEAKELEYLNKELTYNNEAQKFAYHQWQETLDYHKKGQVTAEAEKEAWSKYYDAQIKTAETQKKIADIEMSKFTNDYDKIDKAIETRAKLQENWLKTDGYGATAEQMNARALIDAKADLVDLNKGLAVLQEQHKYAIERYGEENEEVSNAYDAVVEQENKIADKVHTIGQIERNIHEIAIDALEESIDATNDTYELKKAKLGIDAKDTEINNLDIDRLKSNLADITQERKEKLKTIRLIREQMRTGEATQADYDAAVKEHRDYLIEEQNLKNDIARLEKENLELEREALETQYNLASDNADLQYQIWEKTTGRKATGAEKDVAKLSMLSQQLLAQSSLLEMARTEWDEACQKYGKSSNEAQQAYADYLQKQLDIANIQNEISDINDKSVERQKAAHSEYKKYIDKYEKYYLMNGMTREDLERDAKLVSGYDPNKTVQTMVSKTKQALETVQESEGFAEVLDSFSSMGKSYVDSVNDGVSSQVSTIITTMTNAVDECIKAIREKRPSLKETGEYLVEGLVDGIKDKAPTLVRVATQVGASILNTFEKGWDINSPSEEFATLGRYAIMGLAKGLTDNLGMTNQAASMIADGTIDSLRNTISRISEFVESDIDTQPTIRPVLDLSNVESGAARLDAMLSRSQAMSISDNLAKTAKSEEIQNGANGSSSGNTYQFTQNNYSPKALSRAEIYRQTKNQFAAMKEVLV